MIAACAAYLVFLVYGSLVPLHWTPQPLMAAWQAFIQLPGPQWRGEDRVDVAVNFLLMLPLAFGLAHLSATRPSAATRWVGGLLVFPAVAVFSVAIEFCQTFFPPRDPSWTDVAAQWGGALAGMSAYAAAGRRFRTLLDGLAPGHAWQARSRRWLDIYLGLLLIFSVMPLDLTLSPVELYRKWRDGGVVLVPFGAPWPGAWQFAYDLATDIALWVPLGVLWRTDGTGRRLGTVVWRGLAAAALVEGAQLLVLSRVSDITDVLMAGVGVALGAALPGWLRGCSNWERARKRTWLGAVAAVWALVAVMLLWSPFDFTWTHVSADKAVDAFTGLPFQTYFFRGEFGALNEIVRKLLVFLPGGLLLAAWSAQDGRAGPKGRWLLAPCLLAFGLEVGQIFLPSKTADLTDAVLGCVGAWAGWRIASSLTNLMQPDETVVQQPLPDAPSAHAEVAELGSQPAWRGGTLWVIGGLSLLIWLGARLPGLPYNVGKLVPAGWGGALAAAGMAFVLWWVVAAPLMLLNDRRPVWRLALPAGLVLHGLVAFIVLRLAVPLEMIHKIVGTPVLGWGGPLEDLLRYLALHASLMLPLVGAALLVRLTQRPGAIIDVLNWCFLALLLFWPLHWLVVEQAATDNLVELMRGGGSLLASAALASGWGLVALAGSAIAAAVAGGRLRALLGLAAAALAIAPWLLSAGLEPMLVKYGRVFSALQFIVSAGRDRYATGSELVWRAGIALVGLGLIIAALQFRHWRALFAADAAGRPPKRGAPGDLAAA